MEAYLCKASKMREQNGAEVTEEVPKQHWACESAMGLFWQVLLQIKKKAMEMPEK